MKQTFTLSLALFGVIITNVLLYAIIPHYIKDALTLGVTMLFFVFIQVILVYSTIKSERYKGMKDELFKEIRYLFCKEALLGWIIGILIGSILCSFTVLFFGFSDFVKVDINPSAFDIMGVYTAAVLGVLAIRAFYKKFHPITEIDDLLNYLINDLNVNKENYKKPIWFSFPALNIGQFRSEAKYDNVPFAKYKEALNSSILNEDIAFNSITFSEENITKLYRCYGNMFLNEKNKQEIENVVKSCIDTANLFNQSVINAENKNHNSEHTIIEPVSNLGTFIIIGDTVYTIQAWGLPILKFNNKNNEVNFNSPYSNDLEKDSDNKLIKLIAYRQENKLLAKTIIHRTKVILDNDEK